MPTNAEVEVQRQNEQLKKLATETAACWISATVDMNGMSAEHIERIKQLRGDKKQATWQDMGPVDKTYEKYKVSPDDFTEADYADLAKRDPNGFGLQWRDMKIEQITIEFQTKNPSYIATEKNFDRMIRHIRKYQLQDLGCPLDNVMEASYEAGLWSVENLSTVFNALSRQGLLDVPQGVIKPLTKEEQLDCLAMIRQGDTEGASIQYIEYALGGAIPAKYRNNPREFLRDNADLASQAATWVFFSAKSASIDVNDWKRFQKARLAGRPLLTVQVISEAWDDWQFAGRREIPETVEAAPPEPAPKDPNQMTAEELDRAIADARRDALHNQF